MVWDKGATNAKPSQSATPSPTPTPLPSPSPTPTATSSPSTSPTSTPIPTPSQSTTKPWTPPDAPTSWSNLIEKADGIAYWAWKYSSDKIALSQTKLGEVSILVGPNSIPDNPTPLVGLNFVSRLVAKFDEPKKVQIIYAGEKDIEWGQAQIDQFCAQSACGYDVKGEAKKACNVPVTPCWGGLAVRNQRTGVPMIYVTASDWGKTDANHTQGTLESHEYFHNVQQTLLAEVGIDQVPRWLIEGGATWAANAAVFNSSFDNYTNERLRNSNETLVRFKPSAEWLEKFLDPKYTTGWNLWNDNTYSNWNLYDIGSLASEVLVALKGTDTYLNIYKSVGQGKTFAKAFEDLYGISWAEGAKLIAQAIVAQQK